MRPKGRKAGSQVRLEEPNGNIQSGEAGGACEDRTAKLLCFFFFTLELYFLRFNIRKLEDEGREREEGEDL